MGLEVVFGVERHMAMVSMNLNDLHSTLLEISFPFHLHGEILAVMDTIRNDGQRTPLL